MYILRRKIQEDDNKSDVNDDAPMTQIAKEEKRDTGNNDASEDISDLCSFDFDDFVST